MLRIVLALFLAAGPAAAATETAILAGGCFWCVESNFEGVPGVKGVLSGLIGRASRNPSYKDHEGHVEAVQITFDNSRISYAEIVRLFLRSSDVVDAGGQFCDRGAAYATAIFARNPAQRAAAEAEIAQAEQDLGQRVVTPVRNAGTFWKAEEYHQDYYKGSSIVLTRAGPKRQSEAYKFYRKSCGRDARVRQLWGSK